MLVDAMLIHMLFVSIIPPFFFLKGIYGKVLLLKVICILDLKFQPPTIFPISLPYLFLVNMSYY